MNNSEKNIAQEASFHDAIYETRDVDRDKVDRLLNYASPAGTFGARLPRMAKAISKALGDVRGKRILVWIVHEITSRFVYGLA